MHPVRTINHMSGVNDLKNEQGGVALVLVIWILVVLVAIVGEFSYSMRTEINIVRNFKEEEEAYQLALSGIEQAKLELLSSVNNGVVYYNEDNILMIGQSDEVPVRRDTLGSGSFRYTITDEDSKLNINAATVEQIKPLLLQSGVEITDADTIADSIIDWRDPNDLHMLNGAEEEYYQSLDRPYSCKDGEIKSIDELLMVKGMSRDILYGSPPQETDEGTVEEKSYQGIDKFLTVYSAGNVNINTASPAVLETLLGIEESNNIIAQRAEGPIMTARAGGKVTSRFFTIISTGEINDGAIKRSIKMTVVRQNNRLETLYWNDNVIG